MIARVEPLHFKWRLQLASLNLNTARAPLTVTAAERHRDSPGFIRGQEPGGRMTASRPAAAVATGLEAATVSSSRVPTGKPRSALTGQFTASGRPIDRSHCGQTRQCRRGLPLKSDSWPPGLPTHWQAALRDSRAERREPAPCTEPEPPALSGGKCSLSASGSWR
jgi:hypothetical protein